jgi:hypothetical protein
MLTFSFNMINAHVAVLFMWLKDLLFNHGSICLIFVAFVSIFTWYIFVIENYLCNIILLYSSTSILCVQIIVVIASISKCLFCLFTKHYESFFWISLVVDFLSYMMLRNCKYSRFVAWWMEMDRKCCFDVFQHGVDLMWQLLHNMSLFQIVCWQLGGSWAWTFQQVVH